MVEFLGTLTPLDPKRAFNGLERELIYWRDGAACRRPGCGAHVDLDEAEIHHIKPHGEGGTDRDRQRGLGTPALSPKEPLRYRRLRQGELVLGQLGPKHQRPIGYTPKVNGTGVGTILTCWPHREMRRTFVSGRLYGLGHGEGV